MKCRTGLAVLVAGACLSCTLSSEYIVANTTSEALSVRAEFAYDIERARGLAIEFAPVRAMDGYDAWHDAPAGAVTVDPDRRSMHVTLPPGTAASIAGGINCVSPESCEERWLTSLELSGTSGSTRMTGAELRDAFAEGAGRRWVVWYPLTGAHGFWQNMERPHAVRLGLALATAAFTLWAAVLIARTAMPRRWGWAAVALLGVGKFAMNWTTGQTTASFLSLPVVVASISRGDALGPWIVAFSFPLGAIVALLRRQYVLSPPRAHGARGRDPSAGADE